MIHKIKSNPWMPYSHFVDALWGKFSSGKGEGIFSSYWGERSENNDNGSILCVRLFFFFFWDGDLICMKIDKINYTYSGKRHNKSILKDRRIQKYLNPFKSFNFLRLLVKVVTTDIYLILCGLHKFFKTIGFVLMPHIFLFEKIGR